MVLVGRPERHHEAGGAEAALRAVARHHRLLHRMERAFSALQVLHREERLAVERRQELDAGVGAAQAQPADDVVARHAGGRELADDDRAGTAVAFVAAFLGAGAARVLAQPVEDGARRRGAVDLDDRAAVEEADRTARHRTDRHGWLRWYTRD